MAQNTSHAVMQQRVEARDSLDDFPTPPWAGRALMEHVIPVWGEAKEYSLWEPAANRGYLLRGLEDYFHTIRASDVHDYGMGYDVHDYLNAAPRGEDFVITNPPFRLAQAFIEKARAEARVGCAFLVRTSFLEGVSRYRSLWSLTPPTIVAQFSERVPMVKGRCDERASTATSYAWLVWLREWDRRPMMWIPPCRRTLERGSDYEPAEWWITARAVITKPEAARAAQTAEFLRVATETEGRS